MAGRQTKPRGAAGRAVAGAAAAVNPDMIDENGKTAFLSTLFCSKLCRDRGGDWFTFDISTVVSIV